MSDFSHLSALFLNCSLEYDPADSHTARLMSRSAGIMGTEGVSVETVHALEHVIPHGMYPDLTEHGRPRDDWPEIQAKIMAADIFVMGTPIWLGVKSSVATLAVERMYASSGETNDKGQYLYYGKTAGCIVTGNEDSDFTNRNCTFMTWNLMHTAAMLRANGGFPTDGNRAEDYQNFTNAADQSVDPIG